MDDDILVKSFILLIFLILKFMHAIFFTVAKHVLSSF